MNREAFLARVRQAAQVGNAHRVHLKPVPANVGYVGVAGDLCEAMAAEVNTVGGVAEIVSDWASARAALERLLDQYSPHSALAWQHRVLNQVGVEDLLAARKIECLTYEDMIALPPIEQRIRALSADIGITSCDFAVAETGTLVVRARPGQERMASLLPPVHIAIVEQSQIEPDLLNVFEKLAAAGLPNLPSNITLITGPSKTGDIELQLTTGVHGPGKWHVVIVKTMRSHTAQHQL